MRREQRLGAAVFIHLVWSTWDRLPLLSDEIGQEAFQAIGAKCQTLGVESIAIGGVADHVHLLVRLPVTLSIAALVKHLKGASSHLITHEVAPNEFFKWQHAYGACSVSPRRLASVSAYIARQREHHAADTLLLALELPPPGTSGRAAVEP